MSYGRDGVVLRQFADVVRRIHDRPEVAAVVRTVTAIDEYISEAS